MKNRRDFLKLGALAALGASIPGCRKADKPQLEAFTGQYANGKWSVTLQVSDLKAGTPFAVAIWNGSQQDRDGRKYFTIWYRAQ